MDNNNVANIDPGAVVNGLNDAGSDLVAIQDAQVDAEGSKLTDQEHSDFERYKETISKGRDTFLEVGRALVAIRDGHLYREDYGTFEECCAKMWNISRAEGYRLIQDAEIYDDLSPNGDNELPMPISKAQIRALAQVAPEERRTVYAEAVKDAGDQPVTGKHVTDATARRGAAKVRKKKAEFIAKPEEKAEAMKLTNEKARATQAVKQSGRKIEKEHEQDMRPDPDANGEATEADAAYLNMEAAYRLDLKRVKKLDDVQKKDWSQLLNDIVATLGKLGVQVA